MENGEWGNGFHRALAAEAGIIKCPRTWSGQATSLSLVKPNAADMQPASSCTIPTQTPSPTPIPTASEHPAPGIQL